MPTQFTEMNSTNLSFSVQCTYGYVQGILCRSASNVLKKCNVTDTAVMWLWSVCSTDDEKIEWQMVNTILCQF